MSKIMAINAGSSSLKFQLFEMPSETVLTKGLVERIGLDNAVFTISVNGEKQTDITEIPDHAVAVKILVEKLLSQNIIQSYDEITGVGHRVVHGGEKFADSVLITDETLAEIEALSDLAPLHNPANIVGIKAFQDILPNVPAVAVFDTAFHQTMPEKSFLYSLPYEYYEKYGVRKYGFHGTSHKYVSERAAELLGRPIEQLRLISCHLGNGASIAAIEGGKSIDTSMGFTPLAGVAMGTRSGNIDPALIPFIMEKTGKTADEVLNVLNKESGLLGVSGISSDLRDLIKASAEGNERAETALEVFASRIHKYIGSYAARMSGVDAIIFTAGIGENSDVVRARVLRGLEFMGVYWDPALNSVQGEEAFISYPHSPVKVMVIPTDEEVMIARDVTRLANI
ncbi:MULTISPECIES: acetate kinase [Priestia]|jgi:acetate kinase|uniref:Acetate kinase n=7 Tax=Priestia TaxID=2800373 RepID=D5DTW9_PRIM1|nr:MULTISPECIES: acetate kinase [Priestia]AVX10664.1 acetate kinase [Bacillus sp. Y-01]KRD89143.1 acetate kinase [Bacillus sp. Root147]KRD93866.1 acetate kinase [Bacillus sp. Root239]KRF58037.1 acetate kinase [Bacillus sp. Soil531]MBK0007633.1 acetate kinase [Bacillus sp. S35]MBK0292732.1 acetate kinase [Bacillus sp. S34]MBU8850451.1 acetate kinase [Bacillus sp. FJAT-26377]MBZ5477709.1 acetate kinase [Bacillus sp. T_4]MCF6798665.1 acetate kinase [Bacillus sp. ET1]MCJ7984378.1 acetate kina